MSVEKLNIVDFISTSPEGEVRLTISDHLPWDNDNRHLLLLQDKLDAYLSFIESGEIFNKYPDAKDKAINIQVTMKYEPTGDALVFLNRCKETVENAGFHFGWKVISSDKPAL